MGKNIVICSDGTGNTANKDRGTNVFKLYEAVALHGATRQITFYDDGVGTEQLKLLSLMGGAFGLGLARNVRLLYAELVRSYEPGDKIFLFGFSRGAFTVRALGGFITTCGVLNAAHYSDDAALVQAVNAAYNVYREKYFRVNSVRKMWARMRGMKFEQVVHDATNEAQKHVLALRQQRSPHVDVPIEFIGVWDTVAAYGFPVDEVADFWNAYIYPFKFNDHSLSPLVQHACQALAIDEERKTFHPDVWDERSEDRSRPPRIEQVWFSGVHANVGGGYPKQGMSLTTLHWMMEHAITHGLVFNSADRKYVTAHANVNDKLYDSRAGLATVYRYDPRDIAQLCHDNGVEPKLHLSVIERLARATDGYAPGNLPPNNKLISMGTAPPQLDAAQALVDDYIRKNGAPFSKATRWVEAGRRSHFAFVGCLAAAVLILLFADSFKDAVSALLNQDYLSLFKNIAEKAPSRYWVALMFFVTGSAISYLLGRQSGQNADGIYSTYWRGILKDLRVTLNTQQRARQLR